MGQSFMRQNAEQIDKSSTANGKNTYIEIEINAHSEDFCGQFLITNWYSSDLPTGGLPVLSVSVVASFLKTLNPTCLMRVVTGPRVTDCTELAFLSLAQDSCGNNAANHQGVNECVND